MKNILLSLLALSLVFTISGQNTQFSISKCCGDKSANSISWQIDLPLFPDQANNLKSSKGPIIDTLICYDWDTIIANWIENTMEVKLYDTNNRHYETKILKWDGSSWVNDEKTVYTITSMGNIDEIMIYKWDGSAWENHRKTTYFYDPGGYVMEESITYSWDGTAWENLSKSIYDDSGGIISEVITQSWISGNWENERKHTYDYDGMMNPTLEITFEWYNNQWLEYSKYEAVYDIYGAMIESVTSSWDGSAWEYEHMWDVTYFAPWEPLEELHSIWNGTAWEELDKGTYTYDIGHMLVGSLYQQWDGTAWEDIFRNTYTYPGGNCNTTVIITEDWTGSNWVNIEKCISIWCDLTVGIEENVAITDELTIYPNPANDILNISSPYTVDIQIINSHGQLLYSIEFKGEIKLDISNYPPGVYFIKNTSEGNSRVDKIIKK